MFTVESDARRNADKLRNELKSKGVSPEQADRLARRQERQEVRDGNKWIKDNVGLN
jgi:hypothetical protein